MIIYTPLKYASEVAKSRKHFKNIFEILVKFIIMKRVVID